MQDVHAITIKNIYKDFLLPHEKINTLKGGFVSLLRGGRRSKSLQHTLKDVSFDVKKGEFFGIVGRNGSGKSTLLKLIASIYQPTSGSIATNGRLVPFIELGIGLNGELTGRDNVYLSGALFGLSKEEIDEQYTDIVEFAELHDFMDQKLKNYSSGMQVRLAFSVATRTKADILLVDEVLAVGDAAFQQKCFRYFEDLKQSGTTVIFVSHDLDSVARFCDRAALIENGEVKALGATGEVIERYINPLSKKLSKDYKVSGNHQLRTPGLINVKTVISKKDRAIFDKLSNPEIECTVTTKSSCRVAVEITIKRNRLQRVYWFRSDWMDRGFTTIKPNKSVTFKFWLQNIFPKGDYSVDLQIINYDETPIYRQEEVVEFTVDRKGDDAWLLHPTTKIKELS